MKQKPNYSTSDIKDWLKHFAESECKGNAELYFKLCYEISKDDELTKIASYTKVGQPMPNIFLGAVHYLLMKNPQEELSKYYPTISQVENISEIPIDIFKIFCLKYEQEIIEIVSTKIVQTNVVNRCSYLFPIISHLAKKENKPTTIIDIGTSAGLTLNFDNYEYWLNNKKVYGNGTVKIKSEIKEGKIENIEPIAVKLTKIGIDQNIITPLDIEEKLWLKALVWADHKERFDNMDKALDSKEIEQIIFNNGSSIQDFTNIIIDIPKEENLIIYSTHTLYQFNQEEKNQFYKMLDDLGEKRDFYFISAESTKTQLEKYKTKNTVVELTTFKNHKKKEELIAETNGHGNWVSWKQIYLA